MLRLEGYYFTQILYRFRSSLEMKNPWVVYLNIEIRVFDRQYDEVQLPVGGDAGPVGDVGSIQAASSSSIYHTRCVNRNGSELMRKKKEEESKLSKTRGSLSITITCCYFLGPSLALPKSTVV